jgi:hypothetical protein
VALIILLFIFFFNRKALRKILNEDNNGGKGRAAFFAVWMITFFYYIIATIFYGQYQERYRMPLMALFIIPLAAWFTALALNRETRSRIFSAVKIVITAIFLTIWIIQASEAGEKRERLQNLIETTLK